MCALVTGVQTCALPILAGRGRYTGSTAGPVDLERVELLRRLRRLNNVARVLDTALRIPGTNIRFGADSLMGLLPVVRSEEHTSELQSLMRITYAVFCLKKKQLEHIHNTYYKLRS